MNDRRMISDQRRETDPQDSFLLCLLNINPCLFFIILRQINDAVERCSRRLFKHSVPRHGLHRIRWLIFAHLLPGICAKPIELREGQLISTADGSSLEWLITALLYTLGLGAAHIATQYLVDKRGTVVYRWLAPLIATTFLVVRNDSLTRRWLSATYVTLIISSYE